MKNNGTPNNNPDAAQHVTPAPTKTKGRKKQSKSGDDPKKTSKQKKKGLCEGWRASSPLKKAELILLALVAAGGVGYLVAYIVVSNSQKHQTQMQYSPLVINSRPPELLQPFICDREKGLLVGNLNAFIKNVGNVRAIDVLPLIVAMKIVPEKKTGNAFIDNPPGGLCGMITSGKMNLAPGQDFTVMARQGSTSIPKLAESSSVQFYLESCIYYFDEYRTNHSTCDIYRLFLPSSSPPDVLSGSPEFVCDGKPKSGKFLDTGNGCQK
jgi:hypothetical protein